MDDNATARFSTALTNAGSMLSQLSLADLPNNTEVTLPVVIEEPENSIPYLEAAEGTDSLLTAPSGMSMFDVETADERIIEKSPTDLYARSVLLSARDARALLLSHQDLSQDQFYSFTP